MEISIEWSLKSTLMPLIFTTGKVKDICFLIDTGSTNNIIFSYMYEGLKEELGDDFNKVFTKDLDKNEFIMGIEGNKKESRIVEATFNFDGVDYSSTFCVLETPDAINKVFEEHKGLQIHGILGTLFLIENDLVIDYKNYKIWDYDTMFAHKQADGQSGK